MIEGLKDKVVIVTGGGHGIGRAYCLGFGGAGAKVVVADIDEPACVKVAKEVNSQTDAQSLSVKVDVANEASTQNMVKLALERFGKVDILINNAAIFATIPMNRGGIDSIDPDEWDRMMSVSPSRRTRRPSCDRAGLAGLSEAHAAAGIAERGLHLPEPGAGGGAPGGRTTFGRRARRSCRLEGHAHGRRDGLADARQLHRQYRRGDGGRHPRPRRGMPHGGSEQVRRRPRRGNRLSGELLACQRF